MYKKIGTILAIWMISAVCVNARPVSQEKTHLINELSKLFNSNVILDQFTATISDELRSTLELQGVEIDKTVHDILTETTNEVASEIIFNNPIILGQNFRFWDKHYETNEIEELHAFFNSAVGNKYINKTPELTALTMNGIVSVQDAFTFTIQARLLEKFKEAGYDTSNIFADSWNKNPVPLPEPIGPSLQEVTELRLDICPNTKENQKPIPVHRGPPKYPYVAQQYAVEGWVELGFTITEGGYTKDIIVTNTSTGTIFDDAAIEAVGRYVYCEDSQDKKALIRIRFEIEDNKRASSGRNSGN